MTFKVEVPYGEYMPLFRYINELVGCSCFPDLLALKIFPNAKELTESAAAYNAVRHRLKQYDLKDPTVSVVCVGDGCTPRTASMFAFRSAWTCYSVDPNLKGGKWESAIQRLHVVKSKIEHWSGHFEKVIIVAVHSHARLEDSATHVTSNGNRSFVAIPCCVKQTLWGIAPDVEYIDKGIWSPENKVKIWRNA